MQVSSETSVSQPPLVEISYSGQPFDGYLCLKIGTKALDVHLLSIEEYRSQEGTIPLHALVYLLDAHQRDDLRQWLDTLDDLDKLNI
jgi:hypothetical protein